MTPMSKLSSQVPSECPLILTIFVAVCFSTSALFAIPANARGTDPTCINDLKLVLEIQKSIEEFSSHFKNVSAPGNVLGFSKSHTEDLKPEHIISLKKLSDKVGLSPEQVRIRLDSILNSAPNPPIYRAIKLLEVSEITNTPYPKLRASLDSLEELFISSQSKLGFDATKLPQHFNPDQILGLYLGLVSEKSLDISKIYVDFFKTFDNTNADTFLTFIQVLREHKLDPDISMRQLKNFSSLKTRPARRMGIEAHGLSLEKEMPPTLKECLSLLELQTASKISPDAFLVLVEELAQNVAPGDWASVTKTILATLP